MDKVPVYEISEDLANAVLAYLTKRPYVEVYQMVAGLQGLKEIKAEPVAEQSVDKAVGINKKEA